MELGIYYIVSSEEDHARRLADFPRIKALGVNAICTYLLPTDDAFVEKCFQNDIAIVVERGKRDETLSKLTKVMTKFSHAISGIIAWDDVDSPRYKHDPAVVRRMNQLIHSKWPTKKVYISGGYVDRIGMYTDCWQDEILFQGYPIGNGSQVCADAGNIYWTGVDSNGVEWSPVVQTFAWTGQRYPSEMEVRSMMYQAQFFDVPGVFFYTYYDSGNDMTAAAEHRMQLKRIIAEIKLAAEFWG